MPFIPSASPQEVGCQRYSPPCCNTEIIPGGGAINHQMSLRLSKHQVRQNVDCFPAKSLNFTWAIYALKICIRSQYITNTLFFKNVHGVLLLFANLPSILNTRRHNRFHLSIAVFINCRGSKVTVPQIKLLRLVKNNTRHISTHTHACTPTPPHTHTPTHTHNDLRTQTVSCCFMLCDTHIMQKFGFVASLNCTENQHMKFTSTQHLHECHNFYTFDYLNCSFYQG